MALSWQQIAFPFGQGLDTNIHPAQLPPGTMTVLENCIIKQGGSISKRFGFTNLKNSILGNVESIDSAIASSIYNEKELLLFDVNNLYAYSESQEKWINRGTCTSVDSEVIPVINNSYQQLNTSIASYNGISVISWEDSQSTGMIRYSIVDDESGTVLVNNKLIGTDNYKPQSVVFQQLLVIVSTTAAGVIIASVVGVNGNKIDYTLTSDLQTGFANRFSVKSYQNNLFLLYNKSDLTTHCKKYNISFNLVDDLLVKNSDSDNGLYLDITTSSFLVFCTVGQDYFLRVSTYTRNFNNYGLYDGYIDNIYGDDANLTGTELVDNSVYYVLYDSGSSGVMKVEINSFNPTFIKSNLINQPRLSSDAFRYNNRIYFTLEFVLGIQKTTFLMNDLGEVVAKINVNTSGGFRNNKTISQVVVNNDVFLIGSSRLNQIISNDGEIYANAGACILKFDFNSQYQTSMLNQSLYITGGLLQQYDGVSVVEQNFNVYPFVTDYNVVDGYIPNGIYRYQVTYEWTDNNGNIVRSAPSTGDVVTIDRPGGFGDVQVQIRNLILTKKNDVRIVIYRTQTSTANDPLLYRVTDEVDPLINDKYNANVIYTDSALDSDIITNNILYCTVDSQGRLVELENDPSPNCTLITTYKNRLFVAGTDNPNQIYFSKTVVPGESPSFNAGSLYLDVDPIGGPITGIYNLDDSLIIFKENRIFYISGQGPTNTGAQNDFQDSKQIASDVGLLNSNSVVLVASTGLFFQSNKGIFLLDRGLNTVPIGAPVNLFNDQTIISADQIPGTYQIRFTCSDGDLIMYDYFWKQWSTFDNHDGIDAGVYNGKYYHVTSNGIVHLESEDYLDNNKKIDMVVKTGWLSFSQLQGYQRVNYFMLLGDWKGHHTLTFNLYYDGSPSYSDQIIVNTQDIINESTWGSDSQWGDGYWGGEYNTEQWKVFPISGQRCQRIMIEIIENDLDVNGSAAITMVGINFRVGAKISTPIAANKQA